MMQAVTTVAGGLAATAIVGLVCCFLGYVLLERRIDRVEELRRQHATNKLRELLGKR